jgi:uncharacterized protein DUF6677
MSSKSTSVAGARVRASIEPTTIALLCAIAWAIPGAGHFWLGRRQKAIVFFVVLTSMFVIGLLLHGQIFPFELSDPLVALAALADIGLGAPWLIAHMMGFGAGLVTATTWEYGNTFIIVAGLLNSLVVIDAFDIAMGRK